MPAAGVTLYFQLPVGTPDSVHEVPARMPEQAERTVASAAVTLLKRLTTYPGTGVPPTNVLAVHVTVTLPMAAVPLGTFPAGIVLAAAAPEPPAPADQAPAAGAAIASAAARIAAVMIEAGVTADVVRRMSCR
jgi:hypothetical protein